MRLALAVNGHLPLFASDSAFWCNGKNGLEADSRIAAWAPDFVAF